MTELPPFDALAWHVLETWPGAEARAAGEIEQLGHAAFNPRREIRVKRRGGRRGDATRKVAVLEGYVFLGAAQRVNWRQVRAMKSVTGVVEQFTRAPVYAPNTDARWAAAWRGDGEAPVVGYTEGWAPAVLPVGWHKRLLRWLDAGPPPEVDYAPGDLVRVNMEGFAGREVEVRAVDLAKMEARVMFSLFGREVEAPVPTRLLEKSRPAAAAVPDADS